jgi:hypothetical protein
MKAAYEAGLGLEAFTSGKNVLETLAEDAIQHLRRATDLITDHLRAMSETNRGKVEPASDPETVIPETPSSANRPPLQPG